jgi:peptidoglycan hydrolase CwlO-like protein
MMMIDIVALVIFSLVFVIAVKATVFFLFPITDEGAISDSIESIEKAVKTMEDAQKEIEDLRCQLRAMKEKYGDKDE